MCSGRSLQASRRRIKEPPTEAVSVCAIRTVTVWGGRLASSVVVATLANSAGFLTGQLRDDKRSGGQEDVTSLLFLLQLEITMESTININIINIIDILSDIL